MTDQQTGQAPTSEDDFYIQWGRETLKNNIRLCNDLLKQLILVSSTILGLTIIFEKIVVSELFRTLSLLFIFLCLIVALIGLLPYERKIQMNTPGEIKAHKQQALSHKRAYLWVSSILLVVGFALLLAQFFIRLF